MPIERPVIAIRIKPEVAAKRGILPTDTLIRRDVAPLKERRDRFTGHEITGIATVLLEQGLTARDVTFAEGRATYPDQATTEPTPIPYVVEREIKGRFNVGAVETARNVLLGKARAREIHQSRQGFAKLARELEHETVATERRQHGELVKGGYVIRGSFVHTGLVDTLMFKTDEEVGTELQLAGTIGTRQVETALSYLGRHNIDANPSSDTARDQNGTAALLIGASIFPFADELTALASDASAIAKTVSPDATLREKVIRWGVALASDGIQTGADALTLSVGFAWIGIPLSVVDAYVTSPIFLNAAFERMSQRKHSHFARTLGAALVRGDQYNIPPAVRQNLAAQTLHFLAQSGYYDKSVAILQQPVTEQDTAVVRIRREQAELFVALHDAANAVAREQNRAQLPPPQA